MKIVISTPPIADIQTERIKSLVSRSGRRLKPWSQSELSMPLPADIPLKTIDGEAAALGDFAGQTLLIVNVASQRDGTSGLECSRDRDREIL